MATTRTRSRGTLTAAFGSAIVAMIAGCSTPGDSARDDDPIEGDLPSTTIFGAANGVADASESGIELDNGNVPGSENDEDLDDYTDDIDIPAIADDPEMDQPELFENPESGGDG